MKKKRKISYNTKQIITLILGICIAVFMYFNGENIANIKSSEASYNLGNIPKYSNEPYCIINNNIPNFSEEDLKKEAFEEYSNLDSLGRCGVAFAKVGKETMPKENAAGSGRVKRRKKAWQLPIYSSLNTSELR